MNLVTLTCPQCGNNFTKEKKHVNEALRKGYTTTCSYKCQSEMKSKGSMIPCDFCGTEFYKPPSQIQRAKRHFCSKECRKEGLKSKQDS